MYDNVKLLKSKANGEEYEEMRAKALREDQMTAKYFGPNG